MMKQEKNRKEKGLMTVEAVLSLVPFILVILGIISFINIFAVHNRVQYALHQMGGELTAYTYFYQALGIRSADLKLKEDVDRETEELDTAIEDVNSFFNSINTLGGDVNDVKQGNIDANKISGDIQTTVDQGKVVGNTIKKYMRNPKELLAQVIYLGVEKGEQRLKTWLLELMSSGFIEAYLDSSFSTHSPMSADEYLKHYGVKDGVKGLNFDQSKLFSDDRYRMIDFVVEYDIEVYFFRLFLKDPTIHVVQRCKIPAWLDGDGVVYEGK